MNAMAGTASWMIGAAATAAKAPRRALHAVCAARGALFVAVLIASLSALAASAWHYAAKRHENAVIRALDEGRDEPVDMADAPDAVLVARAAYLLNRDRLGDAQTLADVSGPRMEPAARASLLYNLANARLRKAIGAIEKGALDTSIAEVNLAKLGYRQALRLEPGNWDAKHNLDIAMRLVRDLPRQAEFEDEDEEDAPKQLWTDLPGIPKGLP